MLTTLITGGSDYGSIFYKNIKRTFLFLVFLIASYNHMSTCALVQALFKNRYIMALKALYEAI